jgi:hypothetical protein
MNMRQRRKLHAASKTDVMTENYYPLPDDLYPDSKDWQAGDYAARVQWLHCMYESARRDADMWCEEVARLTAPRGDEMKPLRPCCLQAIHERAEAGELSGLGELWRCPNCGQWMRFNGNSWEGIVRKSHLSDDKLPSGTIYIDEDGKFWLAT